MFYITISNGLLKGDHRKRMGAAVWEFMWLIDKTTRIEKNGDGIVLGGKPIKLEDLAETFCVHRDTVSDNLKTLEEQGYIEKKLAPHGIIIRVKKAKKRFGQNTEPPRENTEPPTEKTPNVIRQYSKTVTIRHDVAAPQAAQIDNKTFSAFVDSFETVNPSYQKFYANKTQRAAASRLLEKYGAEKMAAAMAAVKASYGQAYAPRITSPLELEEKLGKEKQFFALVVMQEQQKQGR